MLSEALELIIQWILNEIIIKAWSYITHYSIDSWCNTNQIEYKVLLANDEKEHAINEDAALSDEAFSRNFEGLIIDKNKKYKSTKFNEINTNNNKNVHKKINEFKQKSMKFIYDEVFSMNVMRFQWITGLFNEIRAFLWNSKRNQTKQITFQPP